MDGFNTFLYGENYPIVKWNEQEDINFFVESKKEYHECPVCGKKSNDIYDTHKRKIQDTPIHNKVVYININVREYKCNNKKCKQKTFTEELPFAGKELANIDSKFLNSLNYDNSPPKDKNGKEITFIDLQYDLSDNQYKKHEKNRLKKYEDVLDIRKEKTLSIKELAFKYKYDR